MFVEPLAVVALGQEQPNSQLGRLLLLWALIFAISELLPLLLRPIIHRSRYEFDDLLLASVRAPLRCLLLAGALLNVLPALQFKTWFTTPAVAVLRAVTLIALVWLLQRALEHAIVRVMANAAARTESRMDDLWVTIVRAFVRPVLYATAALIYYQSFNSKDSIVALAVTALAAVVGFGARPVLEDIFSGLSLVLDSPFTRGDLIQLKNGTQAKVEKVGLRVTKLYNPVEHTDITVPNRVLAGEQVINLSRPTTDKRLTLVARVAATSPDRLVRERLKEAAYGHPWVLGNPDRKLPAMRRRIQRLALQGDTQEALALVKELPRVMAERELNAAIQRHAAEIFAMASQVHSMEGDGFDGAESPVVARELNRLPAMVREVEAAMTRWLLMIRYTYVHGAELTLDPDASQRLATALDRLHALPPGSPQTAELRTEALQRVEETVAPALERAERYAQLVREALEGDAPLVRAGRVDRAQLYFATEVQERWFTERGFGAPLGGRGPGGFTDLDAVEEYLGLFGDWSDNMRSFRRTVDDICAELSANGGRLIDEDLLLLRRRLAREMHEAGPEWKEPGVALADSDLGLEYELKVYVDNVKLSHFNRASKTAKQLRQDVVHLLRDSDPPVQLGRPIMLLDPSHVLAQPGSAVRIEDRSG